MFPNDDVSVIQISRAVEEARFPSDAFYEYACAINDCRQDGLRRLDPHLLFAISAIFLYCNKREPLGAPHECEFLRNMITASLAISEGATSDACVQFIRELSSDLNERSLRQECFAGIALAFVLEVLGMATTENDRHAIDLARARMEGAHVYDLTLTPEELDWWIDFGIRLDSGSQQRTRLLDTDSYLVSIECPMTKDGAALRVRRCMRRRDGQRPRASRSPRMAAACVRGRTPATRKSRWSAHSLRAKPHPA